MANEVRIRAQLDYYDSELSAVALAFPPLQVTVASKRFHYAKQSITTSEVALSLGPVTSLGWFLAINRDATNYLEIRTATAGTKIVKLLAGEMCCFRFGSGVTAPFAISDTAAVQLEFLLVSL